MYELEIEGRAERDIEHLKKNLSKGIASYNKVIAKNYESENYSRP